LFQFECEQELYVSSSPFKQRLPKRKTEKHGEKKHILQGGSSISGVFFYVEVEELAALATTRRFSND